MSDRRHVVTDTSVVIEGFFPSGGGPSFHRAQQVLQAILNLTVVCFAPDTLITEFVKVGYDFRRGLRRHSATPDDIDAHIQSFLAMPINYVPSQELAVIALEHCRNDAISPTDSWFLAAAEARSAELWISHFHADGFTANAKKVYDGVFTLAEDDFYSVARRRKG
ncbi:MAG TPA: type II toxin-antitoxin system VapC family toxin [Tepidisphaeraceae bacterium]|jgi:hypothetical protein|nr:type II toxin-antitoxin system VapC family toxin [Tepidisphaeraceae bacterium]